MAQQRRLKENLEIKVQELCSGPNEVYDVRIKDSTHDYKIELPHEITALGNYLKAYVSAKERPFRVHSVFIIDGKTYGGWKTYR